MISSLETNSFFTQKIKMKKRYNNDEIRFHYYFYKKTKIIPENIIYRDPFIFFFINNEHYFKARRFAKSIRTQLSNKKILIIRSESTLIKLLFSFFPDTYIHDITLTINEDGEKVINVLFLFYKDRGIAVGKSGNYIKLLNEVFRKYVQLENNGTPLKIKCDLIEL
ncbi:MAG: hypothetical protein ACFFAO_04225 [Candidatus Hermodarchaeota archaeon]